MQNEPIPRIIHESWHSYLQPLFNDPKMNLIRDSLLPSCTFYPNKPDIFRVFQMPFGAVKVVILGQDPYPKAGQANGLAFAVCENVPIPASLAVIEAEVAREQQVDQLLNPSRRRTLEHWWHQGVMLLNTALTVDAELGAGSHTNQWQWFTREVIHKISLLREEKPVWMLWGGKAKAFKGNIHGYYKWQGQIVDKHYNYVLEAAHPAAETYPNPKDKFTGCNHFTLCNQILKLKHMPEINW